MMNNWNTGALSKQDKLAIITLVGLIVVVLSIVFVNNLNNNIRTDEIKHKVVENPFEKVEIAAKSGVVWDMKEQKIIYAKDSEKVLPLASITKVMTAITATELIPNYTIVKIDKESLEEEGDSGLFVDERWRLRDLLNMSLVMSSNDGVRAIASVAGSVIDTTKNNAVAEVSTTRERFVNDMNERAKKIGMTNTHFKNENGLDKDLVESGAYGTAHDVALMFDYVLRNHSEILESTRYPILTVTSLNNINHNIDNTNIVVNTIPGLLASKTGFTDLAGGNLAIVTDIGLEGPYVIVTLGGTEESRFLDIQKLVRATEEYVIKVK